jgi:hypothetical protein
MITEYHIAILIAVATYYTLTRAQIQRLCCPKDKDGRVTRKRILQLVLLGLLNKTRMEVINPYTRGAGMPVYYLSRKGSELLACELKDERWLNCCTQTPNWQHLAHWTAVADFHIVLDQGFPGQNHATLGGWLGEWDIANPDEKEPHKRYRLFTLISDKPNRLVCNPDAAFLLCAGNYAKIHYLELDRGTSGIQQIAQSKTPGFAELAKRKLHSRHFPATNTDSFFVLSVSPSAERRDLLRKAIAGKLGAELWKFAAWPEITPETVLFGAIWYRCEGDAQPLVRTLTGAIPADIDGSGNGSGSDPGKVRPGPRQQRIGA